eukprot:TRINITY_DN12421_c0_g1_i6.p1 TRINITY_DN12421_c0_g1~~TRINITY_DN12421_c0_g1_i6.p1  ORF type:complete len:199 (+),score=5.78 TRINITY_DN12421_c0_g1_i6:58-654(+)
MSEIVETSTPTKQRRLKILLEGDIGVGKTSLLDRYVTNNFSSTAPPPRIGIDFAIKVIEIDGNPIKLSIWDTPRPDRFQEPFKNYSKIQVILLVYSITDAASFRKISSFLPQIKYSSSQEPNIVALVATKSDLKSSEQVISSEQGRNFAASNNLLFFEVSAKTGDGVDNMFREVVSQALHLPDAVPPPTQPTSQCLIL